MNRHTLSFNLMGCNPRASRSKKNTTIVRYPTATSLGTYVIHPLVPNIPDYTEDRDPEMVTYLAGSGHTVCMKRIYSIYELAPAARDLAL
jgi:hypothetical protein